MPPQRTILPAGHGMRYLLLPTGDRALHNVEQSTSPLVVGGQGDSSPLALTIPLSPRGPGMRRVLPSVLHLYCTSTKKANHDCLHPHNPPLACCWLAWLTTQWTVLQRAKAYRRRRPQIATRYCQNTLPTHTANILCKHSRGTERAGSIEHGTRRQDTRYRTQRARDKLWAAYWDRSSFPD